MDINTQGEKWRVPTTTEANNHTIAATPNANNTAIIFEDEKKGGRRFARTK